MFLSKLEKLTDLSLLHPRLNSLLLLTLTSAFQPQCFVFLQYFVAYLSVYPPFRQPICASISLLLPHPFPPSSFIKHHSSPHFYPNKYRSSLLLLFLSVPLSSIFFFQEENIVWALWMWVVLSYHSTNLSSSLSPVSSITLSLNTQSESPYLCLTCGIVHSFLSHTHTLTQSHRHTHMHSQGFSEEYSFVPVALTVVLYL